MKHFKLYLLIGITVFVYSCDTLQHVQGVVINYNSKAPIDSVKITNFYRDTTNVLPVNCIYTNSNGRFDFKAMTGGLLWSSKLKLIIEKDGYENLIKEYRSCCSDNDTIFLKKIAK